MKFTVKERLLLLQLPPARGSILIVRPLRQFRESLSFNEQEIADLKLVMNGPSIKWDTSVSADKEVEVGPAVKIYIADTLKALSDNSQLSEETVGLYDRFVEE